MTKSRNVGRLFVPPPTRGMDFRIPTGQLTTEYAAWINDFHVQNGRLIKRRSHSEAIDHTNATGWPLAILYNDGEAFYPITVIGNLTEDGTSSVATPADIDSDEFLDHTIYKDTIIVPTNNASGTCRNFTHSSFSWSAGFTFTLDGDRNDRKGICSYRERVYIAEGTKLHYGGVGSTSGAMTAFDVSTHINGKLENCEAIGFSGGESYEQLLVLCTDRGEVLIWSGANPGDSTWRLVQKFDLPIAPGDYVNHWNTELVRLPNDLLVCSRTDHGIYSIRESLTRGQAFQYTPTDSLKQLIAGRVRYEGTPENFIKTTCYWQERNALLVTMVIDKTEVALLDGWGANFADPYSDERRLFIFLVDLDTGHIEAHSASKPSGADEVMRPYRQMQSIGNYVMYPFKGGVLRFFDSEASGQRLDYDSKLIQAWFALAPFNQLGYRIKALKNMVFYSNNHQNHILEYDFRSGLQNRKPTTPHFSIPIGAADYTVKTQILSGNIIDNTALIAFIEYGSTAALPFEFHGLDLIVEQGGEF